MSIGMMLGEVERLDDQIARRRETLDERAREAGYASFGDMERELGTDLGPPDLWRGLLGAAGLADTAPSDTSARAQQALESFRMDLAEVQNLDRRRNSFLVEIHKKFSIPFACLVFILVGGPLGIRTRRGGFANMAIAVAFFITYYLFLIAGEQLADRRFVSPAFAMWLPNMVFGLVGIYLTVSVVGWGTSRGMR